MAFLAFVLLAACAVLTVVWRRVPLLVLGPGLTAAALAAVRIPAVVEWPLLLDVTLILVVVALWMGRRANRAYIDEDLPALSRYGRLGLWLTGDPQWASHADIGLWRVRSETDLAAARPILERAASRRSLTQVHAELLLEAAYGDGHVAELLDQRWEKSGRTVRPVLVQLVIAVLVEEGRTAEALARLGRTPPEVLTDTVRHLVLADLAAATGDRATLEALLARGGTFLDPTRAEIYRATAERASGDTEAGDRRLRSLAVPPAGRTARAIARRLAHPTPVFDESQLDGPARQGLQRYRELARAAVGGAPPQGHDVPR